jgi:hypothetical protein
VAADVSPRQSEAGKSGALPPTQPLRFIDLFCGIGGFRLAFKRVGCECVWCCDWNEPAQTTQLRSPAGRLFLAEMLIEQS